jgi:hypothetical protein
VEFLGQSLPAFLYFGGQVPEPIEVSGLQALLLGLRADVFGFGMVILDQL